MAKKPFGMMGMKEEKTKEPPGEKPMKASGLPDFMQRAKRPGGMAKGGKVHSDAAMDKKLIRKEIARAEKMEDSGMKSGGAVRGIGAAVKGYAKGGMMKMSMKGKK
jgi:hypothetical protein